MGLASHSAAGGISRPRSAAAARSSRAWPRLRQSRAWRSGSASRCRSPPGLMRYFTAVKRWTPLSICCCAGPTGPNRGMVAKPRPPAGSEGGKHFSGRAESQYHWERANPSARTEMSDNGKRGDEGPGTGVVVKTKPKTKKPSMYKVLMLNDDYTPMEFVVHILERFFNKNL